MLTLAELLVLKNEVILTRSSVLQQAANNPHMRWLYHEYDWLYRRICEQEFASKLPLPLPGRG